MTVLQKDQEDDVEDRYEPIRIGDVRFPKLIKIPNTSGTRKAIQIVQPDFSSCCPKTGYPDFGRVILRYVPDKNIVELKSWKLFLAAFYGVGCFHEDVMQRIADAFAECIVPRWFSITIDWSARGGLHTTTQVNWSAGNGYTVFPEDWNYEVFKKQAGSWQNR